MSFAGGAKRRVPLKRRTRKQTATRRVARQEVKKELNRKLETKFIDGYATGAITAISATGSLFSAHGSYSGGTFVPMTQGTGETQYIGERIEPRFLKIRWAMDNYDTPSNIISMVVLQAKGAWTNGGTMSSIYQQTGTTTAPLSAVNDGFNDRFRILYRREITVDVDDTTKQGSIKIGPKKLRRIMFNDASGTVETGLLMIGFISDSTAASHPALRIFWRFYYKDA